MKIRIVLVTSDGRTSGRPSANCAVNPDPTFTGSGKSSPIGTRSEGAAVRVMNQEFTLGEVQEPPSVGLRTVLGIALTTYRMVTFCRIGVNSSSPNEQFLVKSLLPMEPASHTALSDRLAWIVDWLYPPRCRACASRLLGRDAESFCAPCWGQIRLVSHPLCIVCGRPFLDASGDDHTCGACLSRTPHFVRARAWACYPREEVTQHPLRQVVQKFKYGRKVSLGKPLGRLMAQGCEDFLRECQVDLTIPVPLHPKRLRWRGFNQSALLAKQVSRVYKIPMDPFVLFRSKETPPQTQLTEEERRKNMRGAFALNPDRSVEEKRILLVDDVYTSGATVNECSRALLQSGAQEVYVLTLARAV